MAVRPDTLILTAGGLGSLVALAMETAPRRAASSPEKKVRAPGLVYVHDGREAGRQRLEHVRRFADFYGVSTVLELSAEHLHGPAGGVAAARGADGATCAPLAAPQVLLAALQLAERLGAGRLIWAVNRGGDARARALVLEQAALVAQLREACASSGMAAGEAPRVIALETPLLELTTPQLLDLGQRVDASWGLAWSCFLPGTNPCGACAGCRQRRRDFDAAGLVDPLEPNAGTTRSSKRGRSVA